MSETTKTLGELGLTARSGRDAKITGLAVDSRDVRDGYLSRHSPARGCMARTSSNTP